MLESTVTCIHRLALAGNAPACALNFASAKNPGGGWLRGAQAQEEALCRASHLYACIKGSPVHQLAKADANDCLYHDVAIFSPGVPVIKTATGRLIDTPCTAAFITCPAPNAGEARKRGVSEPRIKAALKSRVLTVLAVAAAQGQRHLVLGSFGCGVFRNSVESVAVAFRDGLRQHTGHFSSVTFAVIDPAHAEAFCNVFGIAVSAAAAAAETAAETATTTAAGASLDAGAAARDKAEQRQHPVHPVFTWGYHGRAPADLVAVLDERKAVVMDTRFKPDNATAGWSRAELAQRFRERYIHVAGFGNENYRGRSPRAKTQGEVVLADFAAGLAMVQQQRQLSPVVLICACAELSKCHRHVVSRELAASGVATTELSPRGVQCVAEKAPKRAPSRPKGEVRARQAERRKNRLQ